MITSETLTYSDGHDTMEGLLVARQGTDPRPGVMIAPAFGGRGPVEEARAEILAAEGYVVLIVDYYGAGKRAADHDEAADLMGDLMAKRPILARRMKAALAALQGLDQVKSDRVGAMGFCLGGKAVLDLARSGAAFEAAISIHGVYDPPEAQTKAIQAPILILHGWNDPLAKPTDFVGLATELTDGGAAWQAVAFGGTGHAYTNPAAQDAPSGMAYAHRAAEQSWAATEAFFREHLLR